MKKLSLLLSLILFSVISLNAQNNFIEFEKTTHDFGTFKEEDGSGFSTYSFKFKNVSGAPIQLISVKAGCGCTTPKWTNQTIPPGGSGEVTASYDPVNRPGSFSKEVTVKAGKVNLASGTVTDSLTADTKLLFIKGNVIPRPKGPKDWYPFEDKNLRFSTNHVAFGELYNTEVKTRDFTIYNQGTQPVSIKNVDVKGHIVFDFAGKTVVNPKDSIKVKVTFNGPLCNDWDFLHERATMNTSDSVKTVYISASVRQKFELTPEQKANAPIAKFEKTVHDFGTINDDQTVTHDFVVTNAGKSDLNILKTKASCGCTASEPEKKNLKPGESTVIKVTFSAYGKSGQQSKNVTVITNDPTNDKINLEIKSNIVPKKKEGGENH